MVESSHTGIPIGWTDMEAVLHDSAPLRSSLTGQWENRSIPIKLVASNVPSISWDTSHHPPLSIDLL
jgi:hypothetical protein